MTTLEINQSNEWLTVFSAIAFESVEEEDRDDAANYFTDALVNSLESAGFECVQAKGHRRTVHGWNGANTFRHLLGPVGSFDELLEAEQLTIREAIEHAEEAMLREWTPKD